MGDKTTGLISNILKKIGDAAAAGIKGEIKDLRTLIEQQNKKIDENEKDRIRWEILDFANSCHNGCNHTYDEFKHIMALNDKYKKLLQATNDINGIFEVEYEYIRDLYKEKRRNNTFLTPITKEVIDDEEQL